MSKFAGFNPQQLVEVQRIYRQARRVMENVVSRADSDNWRTVFGQIMGSAQGSALKEAETALKKSLTAMFMRIGGVSFEVRYGGASTDNASMLSGSHAVSGGGSDHTSFIDGLRQDGSAPAMLPMTLYDNWFAMPDYSVTEQSKVETFIHELSHHAAGTIDDKTGGECYEWTGVTRLKGLGPARAIWNAENVAFFCVWAG